MPESFPDSSAGDGERVLYESPLTGEHIAIPLPLEESVDIEHVRAELGLAAWVDLEDQPMRKAAVALWAARAAETAPLRERRQRFGAEPLGVRVFGGAGFRINCPSSNSGPLRRELNDVDYVLSPGEGKGFVELAGELGGAFGSRHMHFVTGEDERFNNLSGGKRFRLQMVREGAGGEVAAADVDVFAQDFNFCHKIVLGAVMETDALTLPLSLLILTKCQFIKAVPADMIDDDRGVRVLTELKGKRVAIGMEDKDLVDVAAAFADHGLDSETMDAGEIVTRTSRDWGLAETVSLNLRNAAAVRRLLDLRGVAEDVQARVVGAMAALADRIEESKPKPPRFRLSSIWWEEVEDG